MMKILITHAYSSTNAGDGLLVTETLRLCQEAFPRAELTVVALDPDSFDLKHDVFHPITGSRFSANSAATVRAALVNLALRRRVASPRFYEEVRNADLVVAVGGGYLRGGTPIELAKTVIAHFGQLPGPTATPAIYLSQSVGPFSGLAGRVVRSRLSTASLVMLRDDRSIEALSLANATRMPDLALLSGHVLPSQEPRDTPDIGLVGRSLPGRRGATYAHRFTQLMRRVNGELLLQAAARGNDDREFYRSLEGSPKAGRSLLDAVTDGPKPSVVISVRLHGALQAIRAGIPAIHLSYERKGWGAYEDLGVKPFVHNAYDFDVDAVARQAEGLSRDPSTYWDDISARRPYLAQARQATLSHIRSAALGSNPN